MQRKATHKSLGSYKQNHDVSNASYFAHLTVFLSLCCLSATSFSQNKAIIKLAFSDKSNFEITNDLGNRMPAVIYLLAKTDTWNSDRFQLDKDLSPAELRQILERDEHSAYHDYIFADTLLDKLFSKNQKQYLFKTSQSVQPGRMAESSQNFRLIRSFNEAKNGFFFSVTDPVFTRKKEYAFVEIISYKKDKDTAEMKDTYFGRTLIIYHKSAGKGWERITKKDFLFL